MNDRPTIVEAAIMRNGEIYIGKRHFEIIKKMVAGGHEKPILVKEQGFVDNNGEYWNRFNARAIAIKAGQIPSDFKGTLLSEDLW